MYTKPNQTKDFFQNLVSLTLFFFIYLLTSPLDAKLPPKLSIAVLRPIDHPALLATEKGFIDRLKTKGYTVGKNLTLDSQSAQGKPLLARDIALGFISRRVDVILSLGTMASQVSKKAIQGTQTRLIFASVTDPQSAGLMPCPGEKTYTGVSNFIDVKPQLEYFKKLYPNLKTLGVIYNPGEDNSVALIDLIQKAGKELGIKIKLAPAPSTALVPQAAKSITPSVDGFFISNDNTALAAFAVVAKVAKERGIPAFCSDGDMIENGATAALGPDQYALGAQAADMLVSWLEKDGEAPAVEYPKVVKTYPETQR